MFGSNINPLASDLVAIVDVIDPDVYTAATYKTAWIPADQFQKFMAIIMAGTLGSSATLNASIVQATALAGTGEKAITGKSITALTQAGTDSDKQAVINLNSDELDIANGFNHIQLQIVVAVATSDAGAMLLGMNKRHGKASSGDAGSVDEIVA